RRLPVRVLSQGQRRRIALARLALAKRALWILDEPLTALDDQAVDVLADLLDAHLSRGGVCVAASHQPMPIAATRAKTLALCGWALARDIRVALRSKGELGVQLLFYVIVVSLFPLATSPSRDVLAMLGPGVLWTAALLASLLSLSRLFASDFHDGTLEQIALSPRPLAALVSGKMVAHWLTTGLPVVVMAPLLGAQYALDASVLATLTLSLLLGTPILSLLGAVGAALTLGARGGGSLLALLVLPLYVPVLIFGA